MLRYINGVTKMSYDLVQHLRETAEAFQCADYDQEAMELDLCRRARAGRNDTGSAAVPDAALAASLRWRRAALRAHVARHESEPPANNPRQRRWSGESAAARSCVCS